MGKGKAALKDISSPDLRREEIFTLEHTDTADTVLCIQGRHPKGTECHLTENYAGDHTGSVRANRVRGQKQDKGKKRGGGSFSRYPENPGQPVVSPLFPECRQPPPQKRAGESRKEQHALGTPTPKSWPAPKV